MFGKETPSSLLPGRWRRGRLGYVFHTDRALFRVRSDTLYPEVKVGFPVWRATLHLLSSWIGLVHFSLSNPPPPEHLQQRLLSGFNFSQLRFRINNVRFHVPVTEYVPHPIKWAVCHRVRNFKKSSAMRVDVHTHIRGYSSVHLFW